MNAFDKEMRILVCLDEYRIGCTMQYAIPEITIDPQLSFCQTCIHEVATAIVECGKQISGKMLLARKSLFLSLNFSSESAGFDNETARLLISTIESDHHLTNLLNRLSTISTDVSRTSESALQSIRTFDFLWRDDSQLKQQTIIQQDETGGDYTITIDPNGIPPADTRQYLQDEPERLVQIEARLNLLPHEIQIGCICICIETVPIINSLLTFVSSWKTPYAKLLHKFAKFQLEQVVAYRQQVQLRFNDDVSTLEQLDEALILLEELGEMENKIEYDEKFC